MSQIFVSYSREDKDFAQRLARALTQHGVSVWLDTLNIEAGKDWDIEIEEAIKRISHFIVLLSKNSVQSKNVRDEIDMAIAERKRILPILMEDCNLPLRLRRVQYTDFRGDFDTAIDVLLKNLPVASERQPLQTLDESPGRSTDNTTRIPIEDIQILLGLDARDPEVYFPEDEEKIRSSRIAILNFYNAKGDLLRNWEIRQEKITVGRSIKCDIVISEKPISRLHATIFKRNGLYYIEDANSSNGTWINEKKIEAVTELKNGDDINLGWIIQIVFSLSDEDDEDTIVLRNHHLSDLDNDLV